MAEAGGRPDGLIVQICANDHPPFRDIVSVYETAGESLGCRVVTIFLAPPFGEPLEGAIYLHQPRLAEVRPVARRLSAAVKDLGSAPILAICHRYRACRTLLASDLDIPRIVTIAHEFGFFRRLQRRIWRWLFARRVWFAGVSPAVQAELGQTVRVPLYLPNGIDVRRFQESLLTRSAALAALGLQAESATPEPFTIGVMGRLIPWKRPGLAIAALGVLARRHEDVRLVLVTGTGQ